MDVVLGRTTTPLTFPPPQEPMPPAKGASMESSLQPLTKLGAPLLFVQPGQDPLCSGLLIRENVDRMPASDIRMIEFPVCGGVGRKAPLQCVGWMGQAIGVMCLVTSREVAHLWWVMAHALDIGWMQGWLPALVSICLSAEGLVATCYVCAAISAQDADGALKSVPPGGQGPAQGPLPHTIKRVAAAVLHFVTAVTDNR